MTPGESRACPRPDSCCEAGGRVLGAISLPGVTRSAPEARAFVGRIAGACLRVAEDVRGDIDLCVSEMVANACEHTASGKGGRIGVVVAVKREVVRVTVVDDGGAAGTPHVAEAYGENGRGLLLVEALALDWGVDEARTGTAVWAEFPAALARMPVEPRCRAASATTRAP
ncbi:ATP-binding protein [Actinomadura viridis]|uniref:ATP-binding protein n=1 Tax=Actinomadura viridis TaxID=58110 RepID=UPI0036987884